MLSLLQILEANIVLLFLALVTFPKSIISQMTLTNISSTCPLPSPCECKWEVSNANPTEEENTIQCLHLNWTNADLPSIPLFNVTISIIDVSFNKLTQLPIDFLQPFSNELKVIRLAYNKFNLVPSVILDMDNLIELDMEGNRLRLRRSMYFQNMPELRKLNLNRNNIIELKSGIFNGLKFLSELKIEHNLIQKISPGAFQDLVSLGDLSLAFNHLKQIGKALFTNLENVDSLDLSHNKINQIHQHAFVGLSAILYINLDHNNLVTLHPNLFLPTKTLVILTMDNNMLNILPESVFDNLVKLLYLSMAHNSMEHLPKKLFSSFAENLMNLGIGYNNITSLPNLFFDNMHNLEALSFFGNPLTSFPDLSALRKLDTLSLSDTKVQHIYPCDFIPLKSLHHFKLWMTPLVCDCDLRWLREWSDEHLDVSTIINKFTWICASPSDKAGRYFHDIPADNFTCNPNRLPHFCHPQHYISVSTMLILTPTNVSAHTVVLVYNLNAPAGIVAEYEQVTWSNQDDSHKSELHLPDNSVELDQLTPGSNYTVCVTLYGDHVTHLITNCTHVSTDGNNSVVKRARGQIVGGIILILAIIIVVISAAIYSYRTPPRCLRMKDQSGIVNTVYNASGAGSVDIQITENSSDSLQILPSIAGADTSDEAKVPSSLKYTSFA